MTAPADIVSAGAVIAIVIVIVIVIVRSLHRGQLLAVDLAIKVKRIDIGHTGDVVND